MKVEPKILEAWFEFKNDLAVDHFLRKDIPAATAGFIAGWNAAMNLLNELE